MVLLFRLWIVTTAVWVALMSASAGEATLFFTHFPQLMWIPLSLLAIGASIVWALKGTML